jgi:D-alanine-D-alanine ligase
MKDFNLEGIRVGVLGGGVSSEREVSLISAQQALKSLQNGKVGCVFVDITTSDKEKVKELLAKQNIDLAFIALHGAFGEDGKIQSILEELEIPYTGSLRLASYLAMDKIVSKAIFLNAGIPTANFLVYWHKGGQGLTDLESLGALRQKIQYPTVVKPYFSGSSLGVSIVYQEDQLLEALKKALSLQSKIVLENYIEGRELTVGILDDKPLGVVEIIPKEGYYDFTAKYSEGMTEFIAPAKLEDTIYEKTQEVALRAHKALGCRHFSRVDIRLRKDSEIFVLEVNSIPGLTSHSLLPLSANACGISFDRLILTMIQLTLHGHKTIKETAES